jgi:hypothetical protein
LLFITFLNCFLTKYIFHMLNFGFFVLIVYITSIARIVHNEFGGLSINLCNHLITLSNCWILIFTRNTASVGARRTRFLLLQA